VTVDLPASTITSVVAPCPAGSKVVGGGFQGVEPTTAVRDSRPSSATAWLVRVHNAGSSADNLSAYAVCMATEPAAVIASLSPAAKKAIRQANKSTQKPRR